MEILTDTGVDRKLADMFDFLGLPREIRDEIYKLCLVREKIEFEEFYTDETIEDWMQDRKPEKLVLRVAKPNEVPLLVYHDMPFVHGVEALTPVDGRSHWEDEIHEHRTRSYRISRDQTGYPYLRIFSTNRMVYQEATVIFYGKNTFSFPSRNCELTLNACSAFLCDRPEQARPYIKNLSLGIGHIVKYPNYVPFISFYSIHKPTIERLSRTLGNMVYLDHLNLFVEEQTPSLKATEAFRNSREYVGLYEWAEELKHINAPKNLVVDLIDSYGSEYKHNRLTQIARHIYDDLWIEASDENFRISSVNALGEEITRARFTWALSKTRSQKAYCGFEWLSKCLIR